MIRLFNMIRLTLFLGIVLSAVNGRFSGLADNIYFAINWAGPVKPVNLKNTALLTEDNAVVVTTTNDEQYRCLLPDLTDDKDQVDPGMSAKYVELELLRPLFDQTSCIYRLETYWTYELCHGRHLRQYHEEKEAGKKPKLQEYFLGRYKMVNFADDLKQAKTLQVIQAEDAKTKNYRFKKVQGIEIPYYEVIYTDGTVCDLTNTARKLALHFVCQPEGRGELYEIKETSSCEYEAIILTNLLCTHPVYGPKKEPVNTIQCHSLSTSPKRPLSLDVMELENTIGHYNRQKRVLNNIWDAISQMIEQDPDQEDADEEEGVSAHSKTPPSPPRSSSTGGHEESSSTRDRQASPLKPVADKQILKDFLAGKYCIQGGTGWWKHEFCYGKQVTQFHEDRGERVEIVLGTWSSAKHLEWVLNNPRKLPRPDKKTISHFYDNGDVCETTGQKRFVEVRLKCAENPSHPNSIALYLVEPKPCEYKLVVESQILCSMIEQADEHGLVLDPRL